MRKVYKSKPNSDEDLEHAMPKLISTPTSTIVRCWLTLKRSWSNLIRSFSTATIMLDPPNWKSPISSPALTSVPSLR